MINANLMIVTGALAISFAPIFVKLVSLSPASVVFYRCLIGFTGIFLYLSFKTKKVPKLNKKTALLALTGGLIFCLDLYLWHKAIHIVGAGMATVLANTQVFFSALWSRFLFKEKPGKNFKYWALLGVLGLYLLCVPELVPQFEPNYLAGIFMAIGAGALYSGFMTCIKIWSKSFPNAPKPAPILWISLTTALWMFLISPSEMEMVRGMNLVHMLLLGLFVHAGGWVLINLAIRALPFSFVSLVLLLQPVLASVISYLLFDESFILQQILGVGICLIAIYRGQLSIIKN